MNFSIGTYVAYSPNKYDFSDDQFVFDGIMKAKIIKRRQPGIFYSSHRGLVCASYGTLLLLEDGSETIAHSSHILMTWKRFIETHASTEIEYQKSLFIKSQTHHKNQVEEAKLAKLNRKEREEKIQIMNDVLEEAFGIIPNHTIYHSHFEFSEEQMWKIVQVVNEKMLLKDFK